MQAVSLVGLQAQQAALTEEIAQMKDELSRVSATLQSTARQLNEETKQLQDCHSKLEVQAIEAASLRKQNTELEADFELYKQVHKELYSLCNFQDNFAQTCNT